MSGIYTSVEQLIGETPLLRLLKIERKLSLEAKLIAKLEYLNPAGSVKDRVAKVMLERAEQRGDIKEGSVIIEPTSGNTGIGLACMGAAKGYNVIIVMPDTMSIERRQLIKAYGAKVVLTKGDMGIKGAIEEAERIAKEIPNSFIPDQFKNKDNPEAHYLTTGPEIYRDTNGKVDIFVAGVGTGGTITGTGRYLKEKKPDVKIIAAEPYGSSVLSTGIAGHHKIQGIGAGFIPEILDTDIYDEVIAIKDEEAFYAMRLMGKTEGILTGISSGCALSAGIEIAKKKENKDKSIVVLLPDTGDRYLSDGAFNE